MKKLKTALIAFMIVSLGTYLLSMLIYSLIGLEVSNTVSYNGIIISLLSGIYSFLRILSN